MDNIIVDNLRMINSTNTQLRRLDVISSFVRLIGKRQVPLELLKKQIITWSVNAEKNIYSYSERNGLLTSNGKPTTAFKKYISLIKEIGVLKQLGSVVSLTTTGLILFSFLKNKDEYPSELSEEEKYYFLHILFSKDGDYLLLIIDLISSQNNNNKQNQLQEQFEKVLLERLESKILYSNKYAKMSLSEKRRIVTTEWQNAKSYSEHIIAPRLEWMIDLNIVTKLNGSYILTKRGEKFKMHLLTINGVNQISEINQFWIFNNSFNAYKSLDILSKNKISFNSLIKEKQIELIGEGILNVLNLFQSGNSLRVRLAPSLIFLSIYSLCYNNIVVEFQEIISLLKESFIFKGKIFQMKNAARITEGYITAKINIK